MSLTKLQQEWDDLASVDPYWAIRTDPARRFGKWDIEEFFATGDAEIEEVIERSATLGYPEGWQSALDFGCGVGRLTRALGRHFGQSFGVDISENMLIKARQLNQASSKVSFFMNAQQNLRLFPNNFFDMIYTNHVLQHVPRKSTIKGYIAEFVRILKENGLLVFQLLSYVPVRNRAQPRARTYALLRTLGFDERFLYERLRLHPLRISFIPVEEVLALLRENGAKMLEVKTDPNFVSSIQSRIYFVTK